MLEQAGPFNDLSEKLRAKLESRVAEFGDQVEYRFDISHPNPDPQRYNGDIVWPRSYSLSPKTFGITDIEEKRAGKSKLKKIGLVDKTDDKGNPASFHSIRITEGQRGVLRLNLKKPEEFAKAMLLELHPENSTGLFPDKDGSLKIKRIDAVAEAKVRTETRNAKKKAWKLLESMDDNAIKLFAAAMMWDEHAEMTIVKEQVEEYAETFPEEFCSLAQNVSRIKYQALVKKSLDRGDMTFDPIEYKYTWRSGEPVVMLTEKSERNHIEAMGEWLLTGDKRSDEVVKRLEGLSK